jgi:hypothetical protein
MRGTLLQSLRIVALLCCSQLLTAQVKLNASLTPGTIGREETTELRFVIEPAGRIDQFTPPALRSFDIISGPNTETGIETINGRSRTYVAVFYRLQPRVTGDIVIGSASVTVNGQLSKSAPVKLKVLPGAAAPPNVQQPAEAYTETGYQDYLLQPGEDVRKKIDRNLFIQVEADKKSCFVGEPVVATYKLFTRLKSESNMVKNPSFNGFSVVELMAPQTGSNYQIEKLNGREYNVYILRKVQLYPLQAGLVILEPAAVENRIQFIRAEFLRQSATDLLSAWMPGALPAEAMLEQQVTVETKPLQVTVKPLPDEGRPASFSGAVGQFNLSALVEKDSLRAGDAGMLKLLLTGAGNMPLIPAPEFTWPAGVEGFEPTVKDGYNKLTVPVSGSRIFDYPFAADVPGRYMLPVVEFSYFDPSKARYETVNTRPIAIHIFQGKEKGKAAASPVLREKPVRGWWILAAVLFLLPVFYFLFRKKKVPVPVLTPAKPVSSAVPVLGQVQQPLLRSEALLMHNNPQLFYETLHRELYHFLAGRLGISPGLVSKKTVVQALNGAGLSPASQMELEVLLDQVDARAFAPFSDAGSMQDDFVRAQRLIRILQC